MSPSVFFLLLLSVIQIKCNTNDILDCEDLSERDEFENGQLAILKVIEPLQIIGIHIRGPFSTFNCMKSSGIAYDLGILNSCHYHSCENGTIVAAVIENFRSYHAGTWNFRITYIDSTSGSSTVDRKIEIYETKYDEIFHNKIIEMKIGEYMVMNFPAIDSKNTKCLMINERTNEIYDLDDVEFDTNIFRVDPCGFRMLVKNKTQGNWSLIGEFGSVRYRAHFNVHINSSIFREKLLIDQYATWTEGFEGSFYDFRNGCQQEYFEFENLAEDIMIVQESGRKIYAGPISNDGNEMWIIRAAKSGSAHLTERRLEPGIENFPEFQFKLTKDHQNHGYSLKVKGQVLSNGDMVKGCTMKYGNKSLDCRSEPNYNIGKSCFHITIPVGIIDNINHMREWELLMDHVIFHMKVVLIGEKKKNWKRYIWHSRQMQKYVNRGETLKVRCVTNKILRTCSLVSPQGKMYIQQNSSFVTEIFCGELDEKICGCKNIIENVNDAHNGTWTCKMDFENGLKVESLVPVRVTESDLIPEAEETNTDDGVVKLHCRISPKKRYRKIVHCMWFHRNIKKNSTGYTISQNDRKCTLEVKSPSDKDNGIWKCSIRLDFGGYRNATVEFPKTLVRREELDEKYEIDIFNGFANGSEEKSVMTGGILKLTCAVSISNFTNAIEWQNIDFSPLNLSDKIKMIRERTTSKYVTILYINPVEITDEKIYACISVQKNDGIPNHVRANYTIKVFEPKIPFFNNTNMFGTQWNYTINAKGNQLPIVFKCYVGGTPEPVISWKKDGMKMDLSTEPQTSLCNAKFINEGQELHIEPSESKCSGQYQCEAKNHLGTTKRNQTVIIEKSSNVPVVDNSERKLDQITAIAEDKNSGEQKFSNTFEIYKHLLIIFILISIVSFGALIYYCTLGKKRWRREIIEADSAMGSFNEVAVGSLNPALMLHEQFQFLPYDEERWEYPIRNLKRLKQLGEGNFGIVDKFRAPNIQGDEKNTIVAVKKLLSLTESNMRALEIELRILCYLKKHPNIVKLLGACTKNVPGGGIWVILEYCHFGSLKAYIDKHKSKFVNQIGIIISGKSDSKLGSIERGVGQSVNVLESAHNEVLDKRFAFMRWINQFTQFLSGKLQKKSRNTSSSYYGLDADGNLRTPRLSNISYDSTDFTRYGEEVPGANELKAFSTGDLLSWSSQVAHGMDFLSENKVLHGDLAARNILLTKNRTAKICDFGLARPIPESKGYYHNEINQERPILNLAIEALREKKFTTKTDVWSFGVLLWELFNLGGRPYGEFLDAISSPNLLNLLENGGRPGKPIYATEKLYEIMHLCWKEEPNDRPSFNYLTKKLKAILNNT